MTGTAQTLNEATLTGEVKLVDTCSGAWSSGTTALTWLRSGPIAAPS